MDWVVWIGVAALGGLTFFSALRFALFRPSRVRLAEEFDRRHRGKALAAFVAARGQHLLATAVLRLICMFAVFVAALHVAGAPVPVELTGKTIGALAAGLLLVSIFGVAIPAAWATYSGEWLVAAVLPILTAARFVCYPVVLLLQIFDPLVRRLAGVPARDEGSYADELEREILSVVSEGEQHGAVDEEEKEMIESVIELADTRVEEIMTPRTDIVALPKDADLDAVLDTVREKGHSRIPVYDETIDRILGVLYAKDLLRRREGNPFELTKTMRKVVYVPESKPVRDLLREFQSMKVHIAVVLDEYGGTAGLVTIEDILEELVGEITDEYETAPAVELKRIDETTVEVDARMKIDDLNDQLHVDLPEDEDYETIGGYVFSRLGRIPEVGERCAYENVGIQVLEAEPRRIIRLRLEISPTSEDQADNT